MKVEFVMLNVIKFIKISTFWAQKNKCAATGYQEFKKKY